MSRKITDPIRASTGKNVESGRVPEKGSGKHRKRVRVSTENGSGRVPKKGSGKYKKSSEKGSVQVPKMVEFRQVPKKGLGEYRRRVQASTEKALGEYRRRVRASTGEGFGQVLKKLRASTREGSGQVPKKLRASTGEGFGQVPKKCLDEYQKMVESERVPEKGIELGRDAEEPLN